MSYKAFYRRYRPSSFEEVVGQENIVKTLVNLIKMKKISHGYLFCGPRGTGKTSMAKIFANALNCIHTIELEKTCDNCLQNSNKSIDIIEIDAASNNSVNDIRTIREQVEFAPTNSPYKIYIVDEVHMLSKSAFNALLMTLEEPPAHAIFIFATTNPDSIPDTILSRVQRYNFKRIPKKDLIERLTFVFDQENVKYDKESIETISFLANGSLRDALSIADQVNAYSNSDITFEKISKVFGLSTIESQVKFINLIAQKKLSEALEFFEKLIEEGIDYSRFVFSLIELLKNFLIYKKTQNVDLITLSNPDILERINLTNNAAYSFLDIFTPLLKEIKYSDLPEHLIQLTIIKICSLEEEFYENQNEKLIEEGAKKEYKDITEEYFVNEVDKDEENDLEKELLLKINNNQNFIKKEFDTKTILSDFSTIEIENSFNTIKEQILNNKLDEINKKNDDEEFESNSYKNEFFAKQRNINDDNELNKSNFESVDFKNVTEEIINNATEALNVSNEEDWGKEEVNEELL
ncbi:MAG: DNA polymerase III subunit gamma/tau, partial [Mycoplasmataceae bacterium]|nr:DNA polymerase III subunit gamma/tau [Mycoplasmataceae bacterium]